METEKGKILQVISNLTRQREEAEAQLVKINELVAERQKEARALVPEKVLREFEKWKKDFEKDLDLLQVTIEQKKKESARLDTAITDRTRTLVELDKKSSRLSEVSQKVTELESLKTTLQKENESLVGSWTILKRELKACQDELVAAEAALEPTKTELGAQKEKIKTDLADFKASIKTEQDKLAAEKGEISERESWLVSKEEELRNLKAELERFYGRKFKHIHI